MKIPSSAIPWNKNVLTNWFIQMELQLSFYSHTVSQALHPCSLCLQLSCSCFQFPSSFTTSPGYSVFFSFVLFLGFHFVFLLQCYSLYFYFLMLIFSLTLRYSFLYQFGVTDKLTNLCHTAIEHMPQRRDGRWLGRFLGKLTLELIPKGPKFTVVNQAEKRAWRWGEYSKGRK